MRGELTVILHPPPFLPRTDFSGHENCPKTFSDREIVRQDTDRGVMERSKFGEMLVR